MYYKNTLFQITARTLLALFLTNTIAPTLQFAFADSTQYYVDSVGWSDANDGLSPATAWQTLAQVNGTSLLQGDTVSLLCSGTWAETLTITAAPGSVWLPININSYGSCPVDTPTIEWINISGSTYVSVNGIDISNSLPGNIVDIDSSFQVTLQNNTISGTNGTCAQVNASSGVIIDGNTITVCQDALIFTGASEWYISNNTVSAIIANGIHVSSQNPVEVSYNTFLNIGENAILFGNDTDVLRNSISTVCTTGSTECAAIRSSPQVSGATTTTITENSIEDIGTGDDALANAGILASSVSGVDIQRNGIQNAQYAVRIIDAANTNIAQNTLLFSRINALSVLQNNSGVVMGNSFTGNTFLQRSPDYPYIEIRDEVPGTGYVGSFITFDSNNILPNYKPNTSYVRTVKFWGETMEYSKTELNSLDANITKFEYFGYKPYVNTWSYATANLITNGDFATDASNWTPSALSGVAPSISYNAVGSHLGWSATFTPNGGITDRFWMTNDSILSITSGQVFHVTGYAKRQNAWTMNLRAFLHSSSDKTVVYSDRIAETFATGTGGFFSFYITASTTAADAQLTFETSNDYNNLEIDEVGIYRLAAHVKNTNTYEVLAYANPTGFDANQGCPGWAQCFAYVDRINATSNWPITIPAYTTAFVLWNASPNIINTPTCTINLSSGSLPTWQPLDISWVATGSFTHTLNYETYTGSITETVGATGARTFIPPYDMVSTISMDLINDVGPNTCSVQVTTTNTAPNIYPTSITGAEDAPQIDGTLSGIDLNPGDNVFFEKFTDPTYGVINVDSTGSIQYFPNPNFCGTDSFLFRASDQYGHYADPITQNIDLECSNDAPVAVNDSGSTSGPMVSLDVLVNDTDIDSPYQVQTFSIVSFTQPLSGSVIQNGNNLEYTPTGSFSGADTFLYRLQDQSGALSTNTGIVTMHVTLPNMAPQAFNMNLSTNEDVILNDVLSWSDINGDILTFTALTLPLSGALNLLPNGTFSYTPDANMFGTDTFDFMANDGSFDSNTGTVTITINSVLDAPIWVDDSYSVNQDTSISVPVMSNDSDVDSTVFSISWITAPSNGTASLSGTTIYYTPNTGYFGADSFTYFLEDDTNQISSAATVNMNVVFTNAAPTADSASRTMNEDATLTGSATGSDPELSTLTYFLDSTTTNGSLTFSSTGGYRYIPNANFNGSDSFTFHVSDGLLTSTSATISLTINPVNDTPVANTATLTAMGNSVVSSGNVSTGALTASDIDGDTLTFTLVTPPVHWLLSMTSTGYLSYTPALGYIGADTFTYRVNDGTVNSTNTVVNINVTDNGVPIPLWYFSLSLPSAAYTGTAVSVTIQARNLAGNIMTNYTGSITFTSSDGLATLPTTTTFAPGDLGVKTLSSAITFLTLWTQSVRVQDTVLSASGVASVLVATPPNYQSVTGPGGTGLASPGSAGIGTGTEQTYVYGSAPGNEPLTQFYFVGEWSEMLNKTMLVNRFIQQDGTLWRGEEGDIPNTPVTPPYIPGNPNTSGWQSRNTMLMNLEEEELSESVSTLSLRLAFWNHIYRAAISDNPDTMYDDARTKLDAYDFSDNERLSMVRDVLLRILDSQQRKYRQIIERDVSVYSSSNDDSLDEVDDTDPLIPDPTVDENLDLSEIDLSELELTDEELALLLEE